MSAGSRYWRLVRIGGAGKSETITIEQLRAFFRQQFPEFADLEEVPDIEVQCRLLDLYRRIEIAGDMNISHLAGLCLRCFISSKIEQVCNYLTAQFGSNHSFTREDLLPCVLNDAFNSLPARVKTSFTPLSVEILQTFDPNRGNLESWTNRLVKHNRELNAFLLEHGVYLLSDWAILNDTKPKQLQRIFVQFHHLSEVYVKQAILLLEGYHAVYRHDRLMQVHSGSLGLCPQPTVGQLSRIADYMLTQPLPPNFGPTTSVSRNCRRLAPEEVLVQLQDVAVLLRRYRIHVRSGRHPTESLSVPEIGRQVESISECSNEEDEETEFLRLYHREFVAALDQAMKRVIGDRITQLQRKNPHKSQQFIKALKLFHCQGLAMSAIAGEVGLQAQYQVTRLLELKALRADVRRQMFYPLYDSILQLSKIYANPERLQNLDKQIEAFLNKHLEEVINEAEVETSHARGHPMRNLFAQRLCQCLNQT